MSRSRFTRNDQQNHNNSCLYFHVILYISVGFILPYQALVVSSADFRWEGCSLSQRDAP